MRIAIDATPLVEPIGGTSRYVIELVSALSECYPSDEFHLITDQATCDLPEGLACRKNVVWEPPVWRGLRGTWWTTGLLWELRRRGIDLFHGTDFSVPYLPLIPSVMMVHDLSPWKQPPIRPRGSARVRRRTPYLLKIATCIVTPTEAIRSELSRAFGVSLRRITAVHLAAFDERKGSPVDAPKIDAPYVLYVGSLDPRKNVQTLIAAWRRARRFVGNLALVLATPTARESAFHEPGLHEFTALCDANVTKLLSGAAVFVYPSFYEGFGLPVLEAMRAGIPVVTSHDLAITEVAGGAALHVDVTSTEALAQKIVSVVTSSETQKKLSDQGKDRALQFSWCRTAERTRDVYAEAIRTF